ncbi:amidohydrolase family protein [Alkalimonas collagenimarina]|uniref:Amidohydrolase family protein n=1 Tax=Alkalimonas collagenimarina TaxID=400390 RepID=A0ABT9GY54_9GAMM|nr:amidohydrolase family protein [Alkalimonas collagenimarina]MDP4535981.1 amidohydrolase family protein [Alkalimonas collagenimarina]
MKTPVLALTALLISCGLYAAPDRLILAGQLLDVRTGELHSQQAILIKQQRIQRITSISELADNERPADVLDLTGYTVLPGLIDMHVHLTSNPQKHGYRRLNDTPTRQALFGVTAAQATLDAGFTTVRNVGASGFADVDLRDAIDEGDIVGPRMRVAGHSICITGGHCDNNLLPHTYKANSFGVANSPDEVRARVRENMKYGANVIKFTATGGVLSRNTDVNASQFSLAEMQSLVAEAHDRGARVAAHAHGLHGMKRAIEAGVDSIEHASFLNDDVLALAAEKGTYLVMDIYVSDYILGEGEAAGILPESLEKERHVGQLQRENFRRAVVAGVNMAFGTDAGVYTHGQNGRQLAYMVEWGMTSLQAIQSATVHAADLLHWYSDEGKQNVGVLEPGAFADLIAVQGNPLQDIRLLESIPVVVKGGQRVK